MFDRKHLSPEVAELAFELFYWFSRFEFALKEMRFLKSDTPGALAQPSWEQFVDKNAKGYTLTDEGKALLDANPNIQVISANGGLEFRDYIFKEGVNDLAKIVAFVKIVRNNLFHGGKSSVDGWDDEERMRKLLPLTVQNLDQLATLGDVLASYKRQY